MSNEFTPADRSRAYRLRSALKSGQEIEPDDDEWLNEYTAKANASTQPSRAAKASKVMHYEEHAAEATGDGAATALAAGSWAREEGRRIDSLIAVGLGAMQNACNIYHQICVDLMNRTAMSEKAQLDLTLSIREHYLARTQAETDAMIAQRQAAFDRQEAAREGDEGEGENQMVKMFEQAVAAKVAAAVMAPTPPKVG
jgi:hypothetical protein